MLRIIIRIWQLQFGLLMLFLFCYNLAGPQDGLTWCVSIAVTLLILTVAVKIIRSRHRSRW
jgi:hypothetical protein